MGLGGLQSPGGSPPGRVHTWNGSSGGSSIARRIAAKNEEREEGMGGPTRKTTTFRPAASLKERANRSRLHFTAARAEHGRGGGAK